MAIGADQPYPGCTCAVTRVQRCFRGGHVVDGDLNQVLSEEALEEMASAAAVRVGCWPFEQQQVMPDAAADLEDTGALLRGLEMIEGRAFAGTRPGAMDAFMGDGG